MIRSIDPSAEQFLLNLSRISARSERAQREIGSGLKLGKPSDDPGHVVDLLITRSGLEQNEQIFANLGRVKTEVDTAESSLQDAVKLLDRALQLGTQGASSLQMAGPRATLGKEVRGLQEQLVSISATVVEGRYVFSGDADQAPAYSLDLSRANGVTLYQGAPATREIMHPTGSRFSVSKTAQELFDDADPTRNVFLAINTLCLALENGPTSPEGSGSYQAEHEAQTEAIRNAVSGVRSAQDHLSAELSFYGAAQNRIKDAIKLSQKLEVRISSELSALEEADMAAAILELNQARFHQEAALSSRSQLPRSSLFDYLG